jgi:hypothetical protein
VSRQVDSFWWLTGAVIVLLAVILVMSALGCAVAEKQGAVVADEQSIVDADRIERVEAALAKIEAHLQIGGDVDQRPGGDATVNEPWTARILAIGQVLSGPITILIYLIAHRWPMVEHVCDAIKGKPRQRRTRATDANT